MEDKFGYQRLRLADDGDELLVPCVILVLALVFANRDLGGVVVGNFLCDLGLDELVFQRSMVNVVCLLMIVYTIFCLRLVGRWALETAVLLIMKVPWLCSEFMLTGILSMTTDMMKNFWRVMGMVLPNTSGFVQVGSKTTQGSIQYF